MAWSGEPRHSRGRALVLRRLHRPKTRATGRCLGPFGLRSLSRAGPYHRSYASLCRVDCCVLLQTCRPRRPAAPWWKAPDSADRGPRTGRITGGIWASQTPPASWAALARVRSGDQPVPRINGKTLRRLRGRVLGASAWGPLHPLVGWIFPLPGSPPPSPGGSPA